MLGVIQLTVRKVDDHQHSIETATMLFHHDSGLARFREIEGLESDDAEVSSTAKVESLKQISKQKLGSMEKSNLVKKSRGTRYWRV